MGLILTFNASAPSGLAADISKEAHARSGTYAVQFDARPGDLDRVFAPLWQALQGQDRADERMQALGPGSGWIKSAAADIFFDD